MNDLTKIELLPLEKRIEDRIRFGRPVSEQFLGSIFAFVRWTFNAFGTVLSRVAILRAATPGQRYAMTHWISPGEDILVRLSGWPKVERVHNRLSVNGARRPHTRSRHQAWLHRRRVAS